jgi:hypothetical protein
VVSPTPEKRKVGGSTPPLTTSFHQRRCSIFLAQTAQLANGFANRSRYGLGEDVPDTGRVLAQAMGVDAQGYGWVGVAKPGGHDMYWDSGRREAAWSRAGGADHAAGAWGSGMAGGVSGLLYLLISLVMSGVTVSG